MRHWSTHLLTELCRQVDPDELPGKLIPVPVGIGPMETVTRLRT